MSFIIRKAEIKDAGGIAKVHVETWQSCYRGQVADGYLDALSVEKRAKRWEEGLSHPKPKNAAFVAKNQGEIYGFCSVGASRDAGVPDSTGELYAIYVHPSKHGQGIGSALMKEGLDSLRTQGFKRATLWVLKTNAPTIGFYESKGWKADGGEKKIEKDDVVLDEMRYGVDLPETV